MSATNSRVNLPFFIYGSLLPGLSRHRSISKFNPTLEDAVLRGGELRANKKKFPILVETDNPEDVVKGMLVHIDKKEDFNLALVELDYIEGYYGAGNHHNLYDRSIKKIEVGEREVDAYVYVGADELMDFALSSPIVPNGNWRDWVRG